MSTLQDAVALIKAGDCDAGQRLLAQILARDPSNEAAWLWMSSVVEGDERRIYCLEQVLKHSPGHPVAQAGLARLRQLQDEPGALPPAGPAVEPLLAATEEPAPEKEPVPEAEAPAGPALDPAMAKDMTDFVIARLDKHESVDNIVLKLCEVSGMSWSDAEAFVRRVEQESRPQIAGRQRPILLLVGGITLFIGAYLAYTSASYLTAFLRSAEAITEDPLLYYIFSTPELTRRVLTLALGTAILVGGLWGTVRAILPPGDKSLLEADATGAETGSIDDFVGIHLSLGDEGTGSRRRRKGKA